MAKVIENSCKKEDIMCDTIIPVLQYAFGARTGQDVQITHNRDEKNKKGSDLTIRIGDREYECDAKCCQPIRDKNYTTHFVEIAQWMLDGQPDWCWHNGWIYSDLGDIIIDVVPMDNGYDTYNMQHYAIYLCDKNRDKKLVQNEYKSPEDAKYEADQLRQKIDDGIVSLNANNTYYAGKTIDGCVKLLTYKKRGLGLSPDNYNIIVPISNSFRFGILHYFGKTVIYDDFEKCDEKRKKITETIKNMD